MGCAARRDGSPWRLAVVALLLTALLHASGAAASRQHVVGERLTLSGRSVVIAHDRLGQPAERSLVVRTPSRLRVHVLPSPELRPAFAAIQTGQDINVTGIWLSRGAGATRTATAAAAGGVGSHAGGHAHAALLPPALQRMQMASAWAAAGSGGNTSLVKAASVAPNALSVYCFMPSVMQLSGGKQATPRVSVASVPVAAAAAGGPMTSAAAVMASNTLVEREVSVLFIPIEAVDPATGQACMGTRIPTMKTADIQKAMFAEKNPGGPTLGGIFNQCSHNKSRVTMQNSLVAERVRLPCAGNTNGYPWSFSKCDFDDFSGYADAADAVLLQRGVDINKYKYKVYLLPPCTCPWVGLGYVGCDGSFECRAWINGDFWGVPQAIAHELGHNMFLGHSSAYNPDGSLDEYGDRGSSMGSCCDPRCFSTPQTWQMGWISVQQLDGTVLKPGTRKQVWLGSHSVAPNAGVRILTPWVNGSDPIFLGFRTAAGGDKALPATLAQRVHIHQSRVSGTFDAVNSLWRGSLATPGASWAHAPSGLVVRFVSLANGGANVMICRKASPAKETLASCKAGQDYDCNGKVGFADPACKALLTAAGLAPPPPSRPPPAPRPPPPLRRPPPPTPVVRTGRLLRQAQ